jgi:acylphosphatase
VSDVRPIERIYCVVTGRVQGVGFRAFVQSAAKRLGLTGWVRNGNDGRTVEMVAEGPHEEVQRFLSIIKAGPPSSSVTHLQQSSLEGPQEFFDFRIRR